MKLLEISKSYSELAISDGCLSFEDVLSHKEAKRDEVCVEIGSGDGSDAIRLAEAVGKDGFVFGIDISDGIIEKTVKTDERLVVSNVEFIKCPLEKIKLSDEIADLVISNCTINHASDKQSAWNEIYRILKRGGRFIISDIYSTSSFPGQYKNEQKSITRNEYLNHLETAGFSTIRILDESIPYSKDGVMVANWTIAGEKPLGECSWCE
jgi:arsenite methyltransferase